MNYAGVDEFLSIKIESPELSTQEEVTYHDIGTEEYSTQNNRDAYHQWNWTVNETKLLLDLYKKFRAMVGTHGIKNLRKLWEVIAKELNEILKTKINPNHCENRWRVLDRAYKKYIDSMNKTGRGKKHFPYAEEMDALYEGRKYVKPPVVLSNKSLEKMPAESDNVSNASVADKNVSPAVKKKVNPVLKRNIILAKMREDRRQYYKDKLEIEKEKLALQKQRNSASEQRNALLKERNELLRNQKCVKCSKQL